MRFDLGPFLRIETSRLVEDGEWNSGFANVMEHGGCMQPFNVGLRKSEAQAEVDRDPHHQKAMLISALVMPPYGFQPVGQAMFGDVVRDMARRGLCRRHVDALAAQYR